MSSKEKKTGCVADFIAQFIFINRKQTIRHQGNYQASKNHNNTFILKKKGDSELLPHRPKGTMAVTDDVVNGITSITNRKMMTSVAVYYCARKRVFVAGAICCFGQLP